MGNSRRIALWGANVRRILQITLLAVAALDPATVAAQMPVQSNAPAPPPERPALVSPMINIRLDPALGDDQAQLRDFLSHYPYVRIAEPADYELTNKRDFPLMLMMQDLRRPFEPWDAFELGNLQQGDYRAPFNLALQKIESIRTLLRLGDSPTPPAIRSCAVSAQGETCHWGAYRETVNFLSPDELSVSELSGTRITNLDKAPRYLAAFWIDDKLGITRVIPASGALLATPSGGTVSSTKLPRYDGVSATSWLVTISSEHPVDATVLEQARFGEDKSPCPPESDPPCASVSQLPSDHRDWKISVAEYRENLGIPAEAGGGEDALKGMAAWMAELYSTAENFDRLKADDLKKVLAKQEYAGQDAAAIAHRCGGTLIARDLVVTAAHCVANKDDFDGEDILTVPRVRRVRLGTLDLCDGCGSTYKIVGVAVHAGYDPHGKVNTDDIALLRIAPDESTDLETKPSPIVLGTAPIGQRDALLLYGWGFTHQSSAFGGNDAVDLQGNVQLTPKTLQFGLVQKDPKDCGQEMRRTDMPNGVVCVIGRTHNVFSCRGDSGGPLTRKHGRREEIVGLTSWSYGCGDKFPSVYTDVTHYTRWISLAAKQLRARGGVIKVNAAGAVVPAVDPAPATRPFK